jgi:hypothetical protein
MKKEASGQFFNLFCPYGQTLVSPPPSTGAVVALKNEERSQRQRELVLKY